MKLRTACLCWLCVAVGWLCGIMFPEQTCVALMAAFVLLWVVSLSQLWRQGRTNAITYQCPSCAYRNPIGEDCCDCGWVPEGRRAR